MQVREERQQQLLHPDLLLMSSWKKVVQVPGMHRSLSKALRLAHKQRMRDGAVAAPRSQRAPLSRLAAGSRDVSGAIVGAPLSATMPPAWSVAMGSQSSTGGGVYPNQPSSFAGLDEPYNGETETSLAMSRAASGTQANSTSGPSFLKQPGRGRARGNRRGSIDDG